MKLVLIILFVVVILFALWVRIAPADSVKWHVVPDVDADQDLVGGVKRRVAGDETTLRVLDDIIQRTDRTQVVAGSVPEGHITYVTRSRVMGFPDYASVYLHENEIKIWSRLRFGHSDLGVNKARVDHWLSQL